MSVAGELVVGGAAVYQTFHFSFKKRGFTLVVNYAVVGAQIAYFFQKNIGVVGRQNRGVAEVVFFRFGVQRVNLPWHKHKHFVLSEHNTLHVYFY